MNAPTQAGLPALPLKDPKLFRTQSYVDGEWIGNGKTFPIVNPATGAKLHSTSIRVVTPPTCRNRTFGTERDTCISDSHQVGQSSGPNGRLADISTSPPPSGVRSRKRTYR